MNQTRDEKSIGRKTTRPIVLAGIVSLAVAMGIGRFAFTPLMPLMLRDGIIDIAAGTEWAAANYIGYFLGALSASWFSGNPRRGVQISLAGIALATFGMVTANNAFLAGGAFLRGAAGVFSAWALVCTSSWGLNELARRKALHRGSWIYTGVGFGIVLTGVMTLLGGWQSANALWLELGALASAGAALAIVSMRNPSAVVKAPMPTAVPPLAFQERRRNLALVICYGSFGFGYIIPATFLPTMARHLTPDPRIFGLVWPIFGLAAILSVAASARLSAWPRARLWALAQGFMALGTLLPLFVQSLFSMAACAVLVGGTFMVATMAGLQLARERMPANPTPLLGRMTAGFAAGQIAGPLLVRAIGAGQPGGWDAMSWANGAATVLLAGTAVWLWRLQSGTDDRFSSNIHAQKE